MYKIGEIIKIKKPHVCGNPYFEVIRIGVDIKIRCLKCERIILMFKKDLDKKVIKRDIDIKSIQI